MSRRAVVPALVLALACGACSDEPAPKTSAPAEAVDLNSPRAKCTAFEPVNVEPPCDDYTRDGLYGGTVTWAEAVDPDTFHPLMSSSATSQELKSLVFDSLTSFDNEKSSDRPSLAWKWEHTPDNLTWTFHLRKGVKWSDGQPFSADDVVFTYQTMLNPKFPNSDVDGFKVGDAPLPDCEAPDANTVVFKCHAVDALFLTHVSVMGIVPKHVWYDKATGPNPTYATAMRLTEPETVIGTGPFKVVSYTSGEKIVYARNPYSWRSTTHGQRLPFADGVICKIVANRDTQSTQFLDGGFDLLNDIQTSDYNRFKEKEAEGWFTLHRPGLSLNVCFLVFNQHPGKDEHSGKPFVEPYKLKWFQDQRFRQAMSHATDRELLVKLFLEGKGEAIWSDTTRGNKTWYADVPKYEHDAAKADKLLDEIGLVKRDAEGFRTDADGHRVSIEIMANNQNQTRIKAMGKIKDLWREVGVEAVLRPSDFNEISRQLDDVHQWESIILGWASAVPPDPLFGKNISLSSGRLHAWYPRQPKPQNEWEQRCDDIIAKMDTEVDVEKRKPLWAEFLRIQAEQQPMLYLYAENCYAASKKRVRNMRASLLRPETWWNIEELWLEDGK